MQGLWPADKAAEGDCAGNETAQEPVSSERLMMDFGKGQSAAFDTLYRRHKDALYRFILRHVGRRAQAEEIYQDTWLKVINARRRYQPKARFETWLYRIAHHRIIDWYRKSRPAALAEPDQVRAAEQTDSVTRQQLSQALNAALLSLPLEQRTTVLLHLERQMTLNQIAQVCGCGRETVKSRLRYATARLRQSLGALYEEL